MSHFINKCRGCQTILSQCRCPDANKPIRWVETCPACPAGTVPITIDVRYSCTLCGILRREVQVPARGTEDVIRWIEDTMIVALAADHQRRSPDCHAKSLSEVMVPITGTDRIGGPPQH